MARKRQEKGLHGSQRRKRRKTWGRRAAQRRAAAARRRARAKPGRDSRPGARSRPRRSRAGIRLAARRGIPPHGRARAFGRRAFGQRLGALRRDPRLALGLGARGGNRARLEAFRRRRSPVFEPVFQIRGRNPGRFSQKRATAPDFSPRRRRFPLAARLARARPFWADAAGRGRPDPRSAPRSRSGSGLGFGQRVVLCPPRRGPSGGSARRIGLRAPGSGRGRIRARGPTGAAAVFLGRVCAPARPARFGPAGSCLQKSFRGGRPRRGRRPQAQRSTVKPVRIRRGEGDVRCGGADRRLPIGAGRRASRLGWPRLAARSEPARFAGPGIGPPCGPADKEG